MKTGESKVGIELQDNRLCSFKGHFNYFKGVKLGDFASEGSGKRQTKRSVNLDAQKKNGQGFLKANINALLKKV